MKSGTLTDQLNSVSQRADALVCRGRYALHAEVFQIWEAGAGGLSLWLGGSRNVVVDRDGHDGWTITTRDLEIGLTINIFLIFSLTSYQIILSSDAYTASYSSSYVQELRLGTGVGEQ
jgi:hypothetical protein